MTIQEFRLPDVGEGLTEAEIVTWHVALGDVVEVNQVIVDIETAKSVVELPSPYAGVVAELMFEAGATVPVGQAIIRIGTDHPEPGAAGSPKADPGSVASDATPALLVGYGARGTSTVRRRRPSTPAGRVLVDPPSGPREPVSDEVSATPPPRPRAKPPVRALARALGVDLATIVLDELGGTISRDDVLRAAEAAEGSATGDRSAAAGSEQRIPIKGVRKHTAAAMVASAFTAPHVTEFITLDVTRTLELREEIQRRREFRDVRLTALSFVARAYLLAVARTPMANARWDEGAQEIVVPTEVNLGIAAATPRGLVVPTIRSAQRLSLLELARSIEELAHVARAGRTSPGAMAGGTTTITNVGVFGVDTGTPILNPGETAILAVGAIRRQPWVVDEGAHERVEPRSILQLALSFDHRVMDGQQGSELLADTAALLREPGLALL